METRMTISEACQHIEWSELVCEGIIFDTSSRKLTLNTTKYGWNSTGEFLGEDGLLNFEGVKQIITNPPMNFMDLEHCRLAFYSHKYLSEDNSSGIELETSVIGNSSECDIDYLILQIMADYVVWQPITNQQKSMTKD